MKSWNGLLALVATIGLTGCPGDDTTTPADDDAGTTTDAATETSSPSTAETTSVETSITDTTSVGTTTSDETTTAADDTTTAADGTTSAADGSSSDGSTSEGSSSSDSGDTGGVCGNGVVDMGEICDGDALGGETCISQGFEGGTLACADDCSGHDTAACIMGGAGACCSANGTPECESMACTTAICADDSFCCSDEWDEICAEAAAVEPACDGVSDCPECGDGMLEMGEVCEDGQLGGETCESLGYESGTLGCAANCGGFDTSECVASQNCCSANIVPECEDAGCTAAICALDPYCCDTEWDGICADAALTQPECQGVSDCPNCGNDMLENAEVCDGANLDGESCETQGYVSGTLGCGADCLSLDETSCQGDGACCAPNGTVGCEDMACTNAVCDVLPACCDDPWSQACADEAAITPECQGLTGCPNCGNGEIEAGEGEVCDGANLGGETCASQGLNMGTLACNATCTDFDITGCFAGGCCEINGSPNCEDQGCSAAICADDPYCCDVTWDDICASSAAMEPACAGVGGCP